jgi:hypothetical protein
MFLLELLLVNAFGDGLRTIVRCVLGVLCFLFCWEAALLSNSLLFNVVFWSVVFIFVCPNWAGRLIGRGIGWLIWHIRRISPLRLYFNRD